jgi:hypothetical protein
MYNLTLKFGFGNKINTKYFYILKIILPLHFQLIAGVVELVDTPDLGSGAERCAGSSPSIRTKKREVLLLFSFFMTIVLNKLNSNHITQTFYKL